MTIIEKFKKFYNNKIDDNKISIDEHDNKFTNHLKNYLIKITPLFYKLKLTPNDITTLGILFNAFAIYNLINGEFMVFIFLAILGHLCDILDGLYARKYNLTTKFGVYYDRFADWLKLMALFFAAYVIYRKHVTIFIYILLYIISFMCNIHYAFKNTLKERQNYKKYEVLKLWTIFLKKVKTKKILQLMRYTNFFDENLSMFYILLVICYLNYKSSK
tara:strand:- start:7 stop:657 length:651 start_codon:yes stop_codon:yes gene_type:complete